MALFAIEHGRSGYWMDFVIHGAIVAALAAVVLLAPSNQWPGLVTLTLVGLVAWTFMEYAIHRFVLHGLSPFKNWHARHHDRPAALMATPTVLSVTLIAALVFLPAFLTVGFWRAGAFTLGVSSGYFAYAITHHATHHWRASSGWMIRRKRWHARHHHLSACYGVTSSFWDRVFGSTCDRRAPN